MNYPEDVGQMGCVVVDCPRHADGDSLYCLHHLTPRTRRNGVRVTVVHYSSLIGARDYEVIVVRSTAKAGKILEIARNEKKDRKLIGVEIRPLVECFDVSDTRFRK